MWSHPASFRRRGAYHKPARRQAPRCAAVLPKHPAAVANFSRFWRRKRASRRLAGPDIGKPTSVELRSGIPSTILPTTASSCDPSQSVHPVQAILHVRPSREHCSSLATRVGWCRDIVQTIRRHQPHGEWEGEGMRWRASTLKFLPRLSSPPTDRYFPLFGYIVRSHMPISPSFREFILVSTAFLSSRPELTSSLRWEVRHTVASQIPLARRRRSRTKATRASRVSGGPPRSQLAEASEMEVNTQHISLKTRTAPDLSQRDVLAVGNLEARLPIQ